MKTKKIIKLGITLLIFIALALGINTVFAQNQPDIDDLLYKFDIIPDESGELGEPMAIEFVASLPAGSPGEIIGRVIFLALIIANILAFASLVVAGIFMLMSQGAPEEITKAKNIFVYTVMAMIIAAIALAIVTGITQFQFFNP